MSSFSGMLWSGTPSLVLQAARNGSVKPLVSEVLLDELKDVIERPKFVSRLQRLGKTASQIVQDYAVLAEIIETEAIERTITADANDDQVLACAFSGHASYIVSGDPHLLEIQQYRDIPILTSSEFLSLLASGNNENQSADNE
jgi:putative PIN family toxin of toxin-antitoxin system